MGRRRSNLPFFAVGVFPGGLEKGSVGLRYLLPAAWWLIHLNKYFGCPQRHDREMLHPQERHVGRFVASILDSDEVEVIVQEMRTELFVPSGSRSLSLCLPLAHSLTLSDNVDLSYRLSGHTPSLVWTEDQAKDCLLCLVCFFL